MSRLQEFHPRSYCGTCKRAKKKDGRDQVAMHFRLVSHPMERWWLRDQWAGHFKGFLNQYPSYRYGMRKHWRQNKRCMKAVVQSGQERPQLLFHRMAKHW